MPFVITGAAFYVWRCDDALDEQEQTARQPSHVLDRYFYPAEVDEAREVFTAALQSQ